MTIELRTIESLATTVIEADLTTLNPASQWVKDPAEQVWRLPVGEWRFAGQISTALLWGGFDFAAIPAAAVITRIVGIVTRSTLAGLFQPQDVSDHAVTLVKDAAGNPKPWGRNVAAGQWPYGSSQSSYAFMQDADSSEALTVDDLKLAKFGFMYAATTLSGRLSSDIEVANPRMVINYLEDV